MAPTGLLAQKMPSNPASSSAAASAGVAQVNPAAPASRWSRATSMSFDVLKCGRSATPACARVPAIAATLARNRAASITRAGVSMLATVRPVITGPP